MTLKIQIIDLWVFKKIFHNIIINLAKDVNYELLEIFTQVTYKYVETTNTKFCRKYNLFR